MEGRHRNNLRRSRLKIVEDLDVVFVIDHLLQHGVIDDEDYDRICGEQTRKAKARRLLDTLPSKGPKAYNTFVESLEKDYSWLSDQLKKLDSFNEYSQDDQLSEVLMRGGVPPQPSYSIKRDGELQEIQKGLRNLACGQFLVLHGMPGCGKSVLAASSLRDSDLVLNNFPGGVFWVKVGMVESDQLLSRIRALCTKLDSPTLPNDVEQGHEILRKLFLSAPLEESLLILDDVWSPEVIQTFSLPVRLMVTTQDSSVMEVANQQYSVIEVKNGFHLQESLSLFSRFLQIPETELPEEAAEIHSEAKGSPMVISMIAGMLAERLQPAQRQASRWSYYLNSLKERRYSKLQKQRSYDHNNVINAVQMSVDNLSEDYRRMYTQLAVFLDDDPIPSQALEMLWGMEKYEVEDTMAKFIKKSLAMAEYDPVQDTYVYTLHDLQLDYLKRSMSKEDESELHRTFVEKYFMSVGNRYGELPNDSYILSHIGYHLERAKMVDSFPVVFLDMEFVEKVVKSCGIAGLLNDYRKYEDYIIGENGEHEDELADFEEFCRTAGVTLCSRSVSGIVQLGLREVSTSAVYLAARSLADQRPECLHLEWRNRSALHSQNIATILHPAIPTSVRFFPDKRLATCSKEKVIKLWNVTNGEVIQRLYGHRGPISCMAVEPGDENDKGEVRFCTGSEDGTAKVWLAAPLHTRRDKLRRGSPKLSKLTLLNELYSSVNDEDDSLATFRYPDLEDVDLNEDPEVTSVAWQPQSHIVAAAGRMGHISVYDISTRKCIHVLKRAHTDTINSIQFSFDGTILASCSDDCTVRLTSTRDWQFLGSLNQHEYRVTELCWLGSTATLASISHQTILLWDSPCPVNGLGKTNVGGLSTRQLKRNRPSSWTCITASTELVAVGTAEDRLVVVWSVASGQVVAALPGLDSPALSLAFSQEGDWLAGVSEDTLMVWCVDQMDNDEHLLALGPPHHTVWLEGKPFTAAPDDLNRISILKDGSTLNRSRPQKNPITVVQLSQDCTRVLFGSCTGEVGCYSPASSLDSSCNGCCSQGAADPNGCDCTVGDRSADSGDQVDILAYHAGLVTAIANSQDCVVTGGLDKQVIISKIGQPPAEAILCRGHSRSVRDVRLVVDDTQVLSCDLDGVLFLWDLRSGERLRDIFGASTPHATCLDVCYCDDSSTTLAAVSGVTGGVKVVDVGSGQQIANINGGKSPIRVCKLGPRGKYVVIGHDSGQVQVYDVASGVAVTSPLLVHSSWVTDIAISEDGSTLLTAGDRLIWWSLVTREPPPVNPAARRRKLSLPLPRCRRTSESKRNSGQFDNDLSTTPQGVGSPYGTPPSRGALSPGGRLYASDSHPTPNSPIAHRKIPKIGTGRHNQLLQTFDIKGTNISKVYVNKDFSEFVTVDDAGILYILEELVPRNPLV